MDDKIHTSQQKRGEYSLAEGKGDGPTESTIPENGGGKGSFTQTSQQIRGEYSLSEPKS